MDSMGARAKRQIITADKGTMENIATLAEKDTREISHNLRQFIATFIHLQKCDYCL